MKKSIRRIVWPGIAVLYALLIACNVGRAFSNGPLTTESAVLSPPQPLVAQNARANPALSTIAGGGLATQASAETIAASASGQTTTSGVSETPAVTGQPVAAPAFSGGSSAPAPTSAADNAPGIPELGNSTALNALGNIRGIARTSTGTSFSKATVRLRDARFGRIVSLQTADSEGAFAFNGIDPGVYVVEALGDGQSVLAASDILTVTAGQTAQAAVRLPFVSPLAGVLGNSTASAAIIAAEAAASGVLSVTPTEPVSATQ